MGKGKKEQQNSARDLDIKLTKLKMGKQDALKKLKDNYETDKANIEIEFEKKLNEIKTEFSIKPKTFCGRVREKLPSIYEMLYLGQNEALNKFSPWANEVCKDFRPNTDKYLKALQQEFNTVMKPMFQELAREENISFNRYRIRNEVFGGCIDLCGEGVEPNYYVEFNMTKIESLGNLLYVLDRRCSAYRNREEAKRKGRLWFTTFAEEDSPHGVVVHLCLPNKWDPMYVLGSFLQNTLQWGNVFSESCWEGFLNKYRSNIQYIEQGFRYFAGTRYPDEVMSQLQLKYWDNNGTTPKGTPLDIIIRDYTI